MHEDLIGRLTFALEKQKAGAFSYLFSEAIAALSAQPDAWSGGEYYADQHGDDAWATYRTGRSGWFYNFGSGDDAEVRAKSVARALNAEVAALAACQPVGQHQVEELRDALGKVRLRCMFIGWPAESMWEATPGNWIPDWRYELQLMEHVLHGSEIRTPEKPTDTVPRNQLPRLVANEPVAKVRQDGGNGPVVWYYPHTFYGTKIPDGADLFLGPPAAAAVPVDVVSELIAAWDERAKAEHAASQDKNWAEWLRERHYGASGAFSTCKIELQEVLATHTQPVAAKEHAHWPQIKLWFFRDLIAEQRAKLFTLCGLGWEGEAMANHSAETMVLRAIIDQQATPEVRNG
ncbi:hypothetical protein [Xanthomonas sp. 3058]|uniref:hypothetical protein n=1 Tax=Xanthomonas sp. 3058 TaxID=3035314 RepID=UPI0016179234|nr:hypothetical protein [Xanthomonas sp. 3058]MBB5862644.1 hypothetical protein [Xanthomonas sp. 3058]